MVKKIEIKSQTEAADSKPAVKKRSETSEVSKTAPKAVKAAPEPFVEKSPCMFTIVDNGDGTISARSRKGDIFKGTRAEFNARLRV